MLPYANDFAIAIQLFKQGKRIINVFSIKLAPSHGFVVQNHATMRYTLVVAK